MNIVTLRQIQECISMAKTAQCRAAMLYRSDLKDEGYEILRRMSQSICDMEQLLLNRIEEDKITNASDIAMIKWFISQAPKDADIGEYFKKMVA